MSSEQLKIPLFCKWHTTGLLYYWRNWCMTGWHLFTQMWSVLLQLRCKQVFLSLTHTYTLTQTLTVSGEQLVEVYSDGHQVLAEHRLPETPQAKAHGPSAGLWGQTREVQRRVGEVINPPTLALVRGEPDDGGKKKTQQKEYKMSSVQIKQKHRSEPTWRL